MCVPLRHHGRLSAASVALNAFNVAAAQHELVSGAGVLDAVKDHPGKVVVRSQLIEQAADGRAFDGRPGGDGKKRMLPSKADG